MNDNSVKELIDSFIAYRNMIAPLEESLRQVSKTYGEIREDLDSLSKNFSSGAMLQLEKVHSAIGAQARSGQELSRRIDEYSQSGEKYAQAVRDMSARFEGVAKSIDALAEIEKSAESQLAKIDGIVNEKRSSYNLKELHKSLDGYNTNVEKISEFINKDIASVLTQNAEKIEEIKKENERLGTAVKEQSNDIATLVSAFRETAALLKKVAESGSVNEEYLFDAFDKWAKDRNVKIKKK